MRGLRVAMIGQRGLPATMGGVEHHVEEIGRRLADRGHDITVFCRTNYATSGLRRYRGMTLRYVPTIATKHLDAVVHSALSTGAAMAGAFDVIHYHALGPGLFSPLPRVLSSASVVQTIHGLDYERAKWGQGTQAILRSAAWLSARVPDTTIVVSRALGSHYEAEHGRAAVYITNGVDPPSHEGARQIQDRYGLTPGSYFLFVGRMVPEKAPDMLVRAFTQVPGGRRLVLAGGSGFTDRYLADLEAMTDRRVLFTGYVCGTLLDELYANAAAFVLPSTVEGLPLTLLEAAAHGTPVVASAIAPHLEVLGGRDGPGHRIFASGDEAGLARALIRAVADPEAERRGASAVRAKVLAEYRWDEAVDATEQVYLGLPSAPGGERRPATRHRSVMSRAMSRS